jgi:hypothetical protein
LSWFLYISIFKSHFVIELVCACRMCDRGDIPGVYARVTSFLPLIKKEMTPIESKFNFNKNQGVRNSDNNLLLFLFIFI